MKAVAKAFDPFFTTKPIGEGTGLGLSMIYGFARQSSGQVRIYSEVGQGTMVCIYLPRHYGEPGRKTGRSLAGKRTGRVGRDGARRRRRAHSADAGHRHSRDLGYQAIEAADSVAGLKIL